MKNWFSLFFIGLAISCNQSNQEPEAAQSNQELSGKEVYLKNCVACHGAKGNLGFSGAINLQTSILTKEERIFQITNGKGAMNPFREIISAEEIEKVAVYLDSLKLPNE